MSTPLQGLLDGSQRPGVYRLDRPRPSLQTDLVASGWRPALMPAVASRGDFYTEIAAALDFPAYFGRNLDALWDCLGDLAEPTALVLQDWVVFAQARPAAWAKILALLTERAEAQPPFAVVLT